MQAFRVAQLSDSAVEGSQIVGGYQRGRVIGTERTLAEGEGLFEQRLRFGGAAFGSIDLREVAHAGDRRGMLSSQGALFGGQRALIKGFGFLMAALLAVQLGQIVDAGER
jgi:hypothetical protein